MTDPVALALVLGVMVIWPLAVVKGDSLLPPTTVQAPITLTDPELSGSIAPAPAQIPEPPAAVRLPPAVAEHDQWRGSQSGVTQPRFALFHHADKWESFWTQGIAPYSRRFAEQPAIDFATEMVVGVFLGERAIPNYEVRILTVRARPAPEGTQLVVRYREIEHMVGVFTPPFPVQPFHLKRVPRFEGPVVFEKAR